MEINVANQANWNWFVEISFPRALPGNDQSAICRLIDNPRPNSVNLNEDFKLFVWSSRKFERLFQLFL